MKRVAVFIVVAFLLMAAMVACESNDTPAADSPPTIEPEGAVEATPAGPATQGEEAYPEPQEPAEAATEGTPQPGEEGYPRPGYNPYPEPQDE